MNHYKDAGLLPVYLDPHNGVTSNFIADLAINMRSVSVNKEALEDILKYGRLTGEKSIFNEFTWINPYNDYRLELEDIRLNPLQRSCKPDYWADLLISKLKKYFITHLKDNETYWVLHSSGGDSRIISGILASLRDEGQLKGDIKFVCWYPEAVQSIRILKSLGWTDNEIFAPGQELGSNINYANYWNETNYYTFNDCGFNTNGEIQPFGMSQSNFWRPYFDSVSDVNVVMAMIGDMVMGGKWWIRWAKKYYLSGKRPKYADNIKWNILINTSARWNGLGVLGYKRNFKSLLPPTMDLDFVNTGLSIPFCARYRDNVRKSMQEKLNQGLSKFENLHSSWYLASNGLSERTFKDYYDSKFYHKYRFNYSSEFGIKYPSLLSLASLYDYLLNHGVRIAL